MVPCTNPSPHLTPTLSIQGLDFEQWNVGFGWKVVGFGYSDGFGVLGFPRGGVASLMVGLSRSHCSMRAFVAGTGAYVALHLVYVAGI